MPKPALLTPWATDANYPADAEPEAGTPTKVAPDIEETIGWRPGKKPPAQKMNGWMNRVGLWVEYMDSIFGNDDSIEVSRVYETVQREYGFHACAWLPRPPASATFNGSLWSISGACDFYAPLSQLRPGDRINQISWVYARGGAGNVRLKVLRRPIIGGGDALIQAEFVDAATVGITETIIGYADHEIATGYSYALRVDLDNVAQTFVSAHVRVDRPRP